MIILSNEELTILKKTVKKSFPRDSEEQIEDFLQKCQLDFVQYPSKLPDNVKNRLAFLKGLIKYKRRISYKAVMENERKFNKYLLREGFGYKSTHHSPATQEIELLKKQATSFLNKKITGPKQKTLLTAIRKTEDLREAADSIGMTYKIAHQTIINMKNELKESLK